MQNGYFRIERPENEKVRTYVPGSRERKQLKEELTRQANTVVKIPLIIGGKEVWTEDRGQVVMPHDHGHVLAEYCRGGERELRMAVEAAMAAREQWAAMDTDHRLSIFLKAADLLAGPHRMEMVAATMLGQSKTVCQAEGDAGCQLADFLRFNVYHLMNIYGDQPKNSEGVWNRMEYRPLDGFVAAVTPFNFTSIGGNLPTAPAIAGNVVFWKPASTSVLSNYYFMRILMETGLPDGVINFVPSRGSDVSRFVVGDSRMAGFHFTGSTEVFSQVWKQVGNSIETYGTYPRLVGETGGKDFIFIHPSASVKAAAAAMVRGAYENQGQKCSAASRTYVPGSLWPKVREMVLEEIGKLNVGDVRDFRNFMGAVIDEASFRKIAAAIDQARASEEAEVLCGGYDGKKGWFIYPTLIEAKTPYYRSMVEELFGPVMTVYVYDDEKLEETVKICDGSTAYGLTGAIFANDRKAIEQLEKWLTHAEGNLYINDKPTGTTVGQQPFGGARASGTNDKAGSILNMQRWVSPRVVKECYVPCEDIAYPFMEEE